MGEQIGGSTQTKAAALARAVNDLLYELVVRAIKDPTQGPRRYYDVAVVGYGATVTTAWQGGLDGRGLVGIDEVARTPLRVDSIDGRKSPVWFDAVANGPTPMCAAMNLAGQLTAEWVRDHRDSFPPIIVNISDGASTDGDPREWGKRLTSLSTSDGRALLFNVNLSAHDGEVKWFPSSPAGLPSDYAVTMFELSSELPGYMAELAGGIGHKVGAGARGFVFNADLTSLVSFLQIGTATQHVSAEIMEG